MTQKPAGPLRDVSSGAGPRSMFQRRLHEKSARACVFCGPSLSGKTPPEGIDVYPPATRGAFAAAVSAGYEVMGFIDGAIEQADRVPLAELRSVLERPGIVVLGGASMGAVRAVQLESAGMRGVGRVFRLLRRRSLSDSDEVFLLHAPGTLRYRPLTMPLVNVRFTLRRLRRAGHIAAAEEQALVAYLRDVPWFDRDSGAVAAAVYRTCGGARSANVLQSFDRLYRDVKHEDAMALCLEMQRIVLGSRRSRGVGYVGIHPFGLRRA
jgi:hypothetical protein